MMNEVEEYSRESRRIHSMVRIRVRIRVRLHLGSMQPMHIPDLGRAVS